ncbi:MAG: hypothetical protein ACYDC2_00585 [Solirubrobacteraceae bacterium]
MVYCVVPKALADEFYPKMVERYRSDPNVEVIVERRQFDRRARSARLGEAPTGAQRRVIRDRRRRRATGDYLPLAQGS